MRGLNVPYREDRRDSSRTRPLRNMDPEDHKLNYEPVGVEETRTDQDQENQQRTGQVLKCPLCPHKILL